MTTSDDEPMFGDEAAAETTHAEPLDDDALLGDEAEPEAAPRPRWVLAILASLVATAAGLVLWGVITKWRGSEYPGVSVIIALAVGWLMRVVSRRSTVPVRIVAVLITALGCVAGSVVGHAAFASEQPAFVVVDFWTLLEDAIPETWEIVTNRVAWTYLIFVAALVLAYLSASPQTKKPKKSSADGIVMVSDPDAEPDPVTDEE